MSTSNTNTNGATPNGSLANTNRNIASVITLGGDPRTEGDSRRGCGCSLALMCLAFGAGLFLGGKINLDNNKPTSDSDLSSLESVTPSDGVASWFSSCGDTSKDKNSGDDSTSYEKLNPVEATKNNIIELQKYIDQREPGLLGKLGIDVPAFLRTNNEYDAEMVLAKLMVEYSKDSNVNADHYYQSILMYYAQYDEDVFNALTNLISQMQYYVYLQQGTPDKTAYNAINDAFAELGLSEDDIKFAVNGFYKLFGLSQQDVVPCDGLK